MPGSVRDDAIEIWNQGVNAVRAQSLISQEVHIDGDWLEIGDACWNRSDYDRLILVGGGKAATAMAASFLDVVGDWLPVQGWINVPGGTERPLPKITVHVARPAGCNEPTSEAVAGTEAILELLRHASPRDLCITLLSGGGSALLSKPVRGVNLEDKLAVIRLLSAAGANITELNTVRKHLSAVKGGGMLAACGANELVTVVLSDVLGDPLDVIASGPTVLDHSTPEQARAILQRFDPNQSLSSKIYEAIDRGRLDRQPPRAGSKTIVIGNNAVAVDAAGIRAESLGYNHAMQSATRCEGSAESVGIHHAEMTLAMLRREAKPGTDEALRPVAPTSPINCLITGGEPTVLLVPADKRGRGGRNQQLVLAAYCHLLEKIDDDAMWSRFAILSGGTDGEDGPTDAAGAVLDESVHRTATSLGIDPRAYLARNDAYTFFEQTGGLLKTGPTGTNVCDLRVVTIRQ